MLKHILIATDGSELADKGIEQGFSLAHAVGAKVTILSVAGPLTDGERIAAFEGGIDDPVLRYEQHIADEMKKRFASIGRRATENGVDVEFTHGINEHAAETIIEMAEQKKCDLIVMSSHGRRGVRRFILGSQTAEVVTHTNIPVLVVR